MAAPDGTLFTGKIPSTPAAPETAVLGVLETSGVDLGGVARLGHGSTVATNALLTRRGAKAGLLTTAGFRDVVIMGRADRDHHIFDMRFRHPADVAGTALLTIDHDEGEDEQWLHLPALGRTARIRGGGRAVPA